MFWIEYKFMSILKKKMKFLIWMLNLLGGKLVSFEYLSFSIYFINSLIIHSRPHVAHTP